MAEDGRIPAELWVAAQLKSCHAQNMPAFLSRRGSAMGGIVMVKVVDTAQRTCRIYTQSRDFDGNSGWLAAFDGNATPESEGDAYIARATTRDPDLWVLEVENRDCIMPFEGKII